MPAPGPPKTNITFGFAMLKAVFMDLYRNVVHCLGEVIKNPLAAVVSSLENSFVVSGLYSEKENGEKIRNKKELINKTSPFLLAH